MNKLGTYEFDKVNERMGKGKILTHISLFTGAGGIDIGFAEAGIETRAMVEWDKYCCQTLRHNFLWEHLQWRKNSDGTPEFKDKEDMKNKIKWYHDPEPVILERDIKTVSTEELLKAANLNVGECGIISGGFPCQGFSTAGLRIIDDPRNSLYKEFVRIVKEACPLFIFAENVPGLVSMAKGEIIKQICEDFANCGYDISWDILNAADFGVPQIRKRVFIIGKRVDALYLPEEGNPQLHLAAMPGKITHPTFYLKRYPANQITSLNNFINKETKEAEQKVIPKLNDFLEAEKCG
jgi:DNA-cytosine methyltransferase